jgi:hypothetical protein
MIHIDNVTHELELHRLPQPIPQGSTKDIRGAMITDMGG